MEDQLSSSGGAAGRLSLLLRTSGQQSPVGASGGHKWAAHTARWPKSDMNKNKKKEQQ